MWDGFNKRKFPRVNVSCDVIVSSEAGEGSTKGITENLGLGGVALVLPQELKRFQECSVSLELKENEPRVECKGKVMWVVPTRELKAKKSSYDTGIEFIDLSQNDLKRIQSYLTNLPQ